MLRTFIRFFLSLFPVLVSACTAQETAKGKDPVSVEVPQKVPEGMATAVMGAGCFWCIEVFLESLDGVREVVSGYAGGEQPNPSYREVAMGKTTHAEVVKVIYDPQVITYRELIDFFWTTHDARREDGVWPDFGSQYRSILLYQNEAEHAAIAASREVYEAKIGEPVGTEIKALDAFYPAEIDHQDYAEKNPDDRYIRSVLQPKLKKLGIEP